MDVLPHDRRPFRRAAAIVAATAVCAMAAAGPTYASTESSYLSILNQERASHGLAPLHVSADLTSVAHGWAETMAASRSLRHNPSLTTQVHNWQTVGENVGYGPDLRDLADAFWQSAEHRDNILEPAYTQVGISAVNADHRIWIVVDFRAPLHQIQSAPASQQRGASRMDERTYPGRLLMFGTTGSAVAFVQRLLGLPATGIFGARTRQAVYAFQRNHHLAVDGIVGPITWSALVRLRA
jgi:peptidoglycan hydrolase-like protein with peptidoglycan-binding domain